MEQLAEQYNTTRMTVYRNKQFAAGVNKLPDEVKSEVLSGKSKATFNEIRNIGNNQELKAIKTKEEFDQFLDESTSQPVPSPNRKPGSKPAIRVVSAVEVVKEQGDSATIPPMVERMEDNPMYQELQTLAALIQNPTTCTKENLLKIGQLIPRIISLLPAWGELNVPL